MPRRWRGLTGDITGAHFHDGALGMTGDVLIPLTDDVNGNLIFGFITGAALTTENINKFLSGGIYINIHTEMNPAGELRGQVYKLAREGYTYLLSGDQEVPAVSTPAYGSGIASIDRDQSNVHFMIAYNELSAPQTMSHFHAGVAGENGGVIFPLSPFFNQDDTFDSAFGYWTDNDDTPFYAAAALAFREDSVYVNVHTSANPGGEIRGDVRRMLVCSQGPLALFETPERKVLGAYPNPASEVVTIELGNLPAGNYQMIISDITGKLVEQQIVNPASVSLLRMDISKYKSGVYVMSIVGNAANYTARIVKD